MTFPDPGSLRSCTVPLPAGTVVDGLAFAAGAGAGDGAVLDRSHRTMAGRGRAASLDYPRGLLAGDPAAVTTWLGAIRAVDPLERAGSGPVAFGALPFGAGEPARLVVPALTVARTGDEVWATVVEADVGPDPASAEVVDRALAALAGPPPARPAQRGPGELLVPVPSEEDFVRACEAALDAITAGEVSKVVLARRVDARFDRPVDVHTVLARFRALEPACTVFGILDADRSFIGASPELLVSRRGDRIVSHPLAGTAGLAPPGPAEDPASRSALDHLVGSAKETEEHRLVVDAIAGILAPLCDRLEVPLSPEVVRLATVAHLGTRLVGRLAPGPNRPDVLDLVAALHPTPAVAGSPTAAALALLERLEEGGRGRYAGPVGWVDSRGDGEFVVGIRSATVEGDRASVHAGAGIVAGSDPKEELAETALKLRTALGALEG